MEIKGKDYNPDAFDEIDLRDRKRHEEEMAEAFLRLENRKRKNKKTLISALAGVGVGILYILWIAFGPSIMVGGVSLYERYISLSFGSPLFSMVLDFAPPIVLSGVLGFLAGKGEKGRVVFIFNSIVITTLITLIFMLYISLMAG